MRRVSYSLVKMWAGRGLQTCLCVVIFTTRSHRSLKPSAESPFTHRSVWMIEQKKSRKSCPSHMFSITLIRSSWDDFSSRKIRFWWTVCIFLEIHRSDDRSLFITIYCMITTAQAVVADSRTALVDCSLWATSSLWLLLVISTQRATHTHTRSWMHKHIYVSFTLLQRCDLL